MLDASTIILGFTGSIGSGSTFISKNIGNYTRNRLCYKHFKLSSTLKSQLTADGNTTPTIQELQDKGNQLRRDNGGEYLARILIDQLDKDEEEYQVIIVDGIKNSNEVKFLQQFPNFFLFSIQADDTLRKGRCIKSHSVPNAEEFDRIDKRDQMESPAYGQQVKLCNDLSDIIIENKRNVARASQKVKDDFFRDIYNGYVELIENLVLGMRTPERPPSTDELAMTMAYSASKMSSCEKRKVGAVIIKNNNSKVSPDNAAISAVNFPSTVSMGYNEVPPGSIKCLFHPEYEKCYRAHLQEKAAKTILYCPNCGIVIPFSCTCDKCKLEIKEFFKNCPQCGNEIDSGVTCQGCQKRIFDEYLPGGKLSPGKLLDMCRAVHAEEMAILNLSNVGLTVRDGLTLYTTTQPCNLCANKIAMSGIKEVVFAEPYDMKEAVEILQSAGVRTRRFSGVKSKAFFRLYQ